MVGAPMRKPTLVAEILSVGTELLLGQITDTNATYISQAFAQIGIDVHFRVTVGDNLDRITRSIAAAMGRSDVVLITGGLGPTTDDLTRESVAAAVGCGLRMDEGAKAALVRFFAGRGRPMSDSNLKQALVPEAGDLLDNPLGTAPGIHACRDGKHIFAVPGVPHEMRAMVRDAVIPLLLELMPQRQVIRSRALHLIGVGESAMAAKVEDILVGQTNPTVAPLVGEGDVILRITAKAGSDEEAGGLIAETEARLRERIGEYVYAVGDEPIEAWLVHTLIARGLKVAAAESCTGGLISHRVTNISGSSQCFAGSVVSYSNEAKTSVLGIDEALMESHGAVSAEVAEAMAVRVRALFAADFGISATGIAGPTGATQDKPVGLAFTGLAAADGIETQRHVFTQDRSVNKQRTSQAALVMLRNRLVDLP